jgi:hypothetical protein
MRSLLEQNLSTEPDIQATVPRPFRRGEVGQALPRKGVNHVVFDGPALVAAPDASLPFPKRSRCHRSHGICLAGRGTYRAKVIAMQLNDRGVTTPSPAPDLTEHHRVRPMNLHPIAASGCLGHRSEEIVTTHSR